MMWMGEWGGFFQSVVSGNIRYSCCSQEMIEAITGGRGVQKHIDS
jgi:hypothetical protein